MKKQFTLPLGFLALLFSSLWLAAYKPVSDPEEKIREIDREVNRIETDLGIYKHKHHKTMDCFGWDIYYDTTQIVKFFNYQSCFRLNYYYHEGRLILVTIDGSFPRTCGYTQANYCWNTDIPRNFKAKLYYHRGKLLKDIEEGAHPCCPISPGGYVGDSIEFKQKAKLFLTEYGKTKELESLIY